MAVMSYLMMTSLMIAPQKSSSSSYDVACIPVFRNGTPNR